MIEFSIPDSNGTNKLNALLLECIKAKPFMFYDDFKISSVYGTFNGCTWNGGRDIFGIMSEEECKQWLNYYNSKGISYRYTFTNKYFNETDKFDRYCNMLLRINKVNKGITYNSELLKEYVKTNYPSYYFVSSCTRNKTNIDEINNISEHELLVLDFRLNNTEIINQLKHPRNIEIIVNEQCMDNCPYRVLHYDYMARKNMFIETKDFELNKMCKHKKGTYCNHVQTRKHYVSRKDIYEKYVPLGITKFKVVGRHQDLPDLALMSYLDYFVKEEYKNMFLELCKQNQIIGEKYGSSNY